MAFYLKRKSGSNLKLGASKNLSMLTWIAKEKGFFSDENLKLEIKFSPYAKKSMEIFMEGEVDCAILVETNVAYLGYLKPKIPVKCIASLEQRFADSILIRHTTGEKLRPSDLHGKTVGFMPRTTSHSFLHKFIEHYNLDAKQIKVKVITPQAIADAIIRGDVDAISCFEPFIYQTTIAMTELGIPHTVMINPGFFRSEVVLAVNKTILVKHRTNLEKFLKALRVAENYMKNQPDDCLPIFTRSLKLEGCDYADIFQQYQPKLKPVGPEYLENVEFLGKWIREKDTQFQNHTLPDYTDFIDNSLFFDIFGRDDV